MTWHTPNSQSWLAQACRKSSSSSYSDHLAFLVCRWFRAQGVPVKMTHHMTKPTMPAKRRLQLSKAQAGPHCASSRYQAEHTGQDQPARLLLCDFDKTIADFDAGQLLQHMSSGEQVTGRNSCTFDTIYLSFKNQPCAAPSTIDIKDEWLIANCGTGASADCMLHKWGNVLHHCGSEPHSPVQLRACTADQVGSMSRTVPGSTCIVCCYYGVLTELLSTLAGSPQHPCSQVSAHAEDKAQAGASLWLPGDAALTLICLQQCIETGCDMVATWLSCEPRLVLYTGERLVEELAPELVPMLQTIEMPANFVPVTNAVLAEMARRGIGRQDILTVLRQMGTELPEESVELIQVGLSFELTHTDITSLLLGCTCLFVY